MQRLLLCLALYSTACDPAGADTPAPSRKDTVSDVRRANADSNTARRNEIFPTTIHRAYLVLGTNSGQHDSRGKPVRISCLTCHIHLKPAKENAQATQLTRFHRGIKIEHGEQSCLTCHRKDSRDGFGLADGSSLDYRDVMLLCGQCHASRLEEYRHGAHGGMNGFWDVKRGPRIRNHCLDCHNPHAPAIPKVIPAPLPHQNNRDEKERDV